MDVTAARKRAIFLGFVTGLAVGLALAALSAGLIAWGALLKRQRDLAADWQPQLVVVVKEPVRAGEIVQRADVEGRAVPGVLATANTVHPGEADQIIAGARARVDLAPGDILLRSSVGLPLRAEP